MGQGVAFPFGYADVQQPSYAAIQPITISDLFTIIDPAILTGAMTINLTLETGVRAGAMILVQLTATATEVTTFGTGFTAPTVTGVAGKTKQQLFIYDGASFKPVSAAFQID